MVAWLGRRSVWRRAGLVAAIGCLVAAVVLAGLVAAPWARGPRAAGDQIPELAFPVDVGDHTAIDVQAAGPARRRLTRGIGLLWKLGFDFPSGRRSESGLQVTVYGCQSLPGECGEVRAESAEAQASSQLESGTCTVAVDEVAVAASAGELRIDTDRWFAAVLAHELTHCDGQHREDVAETRGTLWVGRQLGDRRIVQDALNAIRYDIDEDGNWKR
jgi:hypothetical protein